MLTHIIIGKKLGWLANIEVAMNNAMSKSAAMLQIPIEFLEIRKMNIHLGIRRQILLPSEPFQNEIKLWAEPT